MATFQNHRGVLIEVTCVAFVGLVVVFIDFSIVPYQRGFFCDDDSIRYPFRENTISTGLLLIGSFTIPSLVFLVVEGFRLFDTSTPRDSWNTVTCNLLLSLYEKFGVFLFGSGLNQITVDIAKYTVGRMRPHFINVCNLSPNPCTTSSYHTYITDYKCTGDHEVIMEARLSFPSGHAALAFYSAVYASVFLQHRLSWRSMRLPKHLAQSILLFVAWFTSLSRVHDNMHHPTDVIAGMAIGITWAFIMTFCVIDMRLDPSLTTKDELRSLRTHPAHIQGSNNV